MVVTTTESPTTFASSLFGKFLVKSSNGRKSIKNSLREFFSRNKVTKIHQKDEYYDELVHDKIRVFVSFPHVGTFSISAETTSDVYDAIKYRVLTDENNKGMTLKQVNSLLERLHVFYGMTPLKRATVPLAIYGIGPDATLIIRTFNLLGGFKTPSELKKIEVSDIILPTYSHIAQCERDVLKKFELQYMERAQQAESTLYSMIATWLQDKNISEEFIVKMVEDVNVFIRLFISSKDMNGCIYSIISFIKFRTGKALFTQQNVLLFIEYFQNLFSSDFETQSFEAVFADARTYLDKYEELRHAPIFKKLYKMGMYALSFSVFDALGINFSLFQFTTLEAEAIKRKYHMGPDFVHTMLTTLLFLCERGYQCIKTGSLDPIYHSGSTYEKWFEQAALLKSRATLLAFPEAHGFTLFEYLADIRECIEKGNSIYKHASRVGEYERKMVRSLVNDLSMILANQTTKREAQKERDAPFCVCLYGGSSIGKTTITDMLFLQYGKTFDLPLGSEFKYTHNPTAKYWDGFNSSQWFVIMDDIAFMHPNKAAAGDPSVMETIQTNNRVAFVPDQADLADKGRTPFRARCVVATTNCEDLNAVHYFQTPLAMQRRFPYTIDVRVKPEHIKDECMLDSSTTSIVDGEWPDYWIFIIKRPVPHGDSRKGQRADLVEVDKFTDVNDFLAWFSRVSVEHERIQRLVGDSASNMAQIELCKKCYRSTRKCTCLETQGWTFAEKAKKVVLDGAISVVQTTLFHKAVSTVLDTKVVRSQLEEMFVADATRLQQLREEEMLYLPHLFGDGEEHFEDAIEADEVSYFEATKTQFRVLGERVQESIGYPALIGTIVAACGVIAGVYKMYTIFNAPLTPQGSNLSKEIGTKPVGNDETANVWFRDDYELSSFDVSSRSTSWNTLSRDQITVRLAENVIHIASSYTTSTSEKTMVRLGKAVCLAGHIYIANNHTIPDSSDLQMCLTLDKAVEGISRNITILVKQSEIVRYADCDICVFRLRCLPPKKDITSLFATAATRFKSDGIIVGRNEGGEIAANSVRALAYAGRQGNDLDYSIEHTWTYSPSYPTVRGDCGAIVLGYSNMGPIIVGIHALGQPNGRYGACVAITREMVMEYVKLYPEPIVESSTPMLSSQSAPRELTELHPKSVFRYIDQGTANVYGSFSGFKQSPKSRVVPTLIQASVLEEGYEVKHGKPVMKGWAPWRIAALDMTKPITQLDNDCIMRCKDAFLADILNNISHDQLMMVSVYDDVTTLNGAAGVKFVDKMNRQTSMGDPWKKGKKYFLQPIPEQDGLTEPMEFTEEIRDRIDVIIERYHSGERFMPSFCGHLKDDPTTFKKIDAGKTRLFCGGPGDWSFVVRKYLLSVIRLIQNNKYVFETGVGTNACSPEWQEMRSYLTKFGEERMIAGDYGNFDKCMSPNIILASFDILRSICAAAGYTDDDLKVIQGIAEDTAFPMVDFNGDLVEFYGSNPSGHPLTVIINSIANSLYMRYCYAKLSPIQEPTHFKRDVALMTYGDDNVMGVSSEAPFFNHTQIQRILHEAGIKYTMADKEAMSIPYIPMSQVSFLKRTWRWDEDVGAYLAPLDEESIGKMLTVCVRSKSLSAEYHAIAVLECAHREYFYFGKKIFEQKKAMIERIVQKNDLELYTARNSFPTWDDFKDRFWSPTQC